MHDTRVVMKDGKTYNGPLWTFRPKEGYIDISDDTNGLTRLNLSDIKSAITKGDRISINRIGDVDELERARKNGWVELE